MYWSIGAVGCLALIVVIGAICGIRAKEVMHCVGSSLILLLLLLATGFVALDYMGGAMIAALKERAQMGV